MTKPATAARYQTSDPSETIGDNTADASNTDAATRRQQMMFIRALQPGHVVVTGLTGNQRAIVRIASACAGPILMPPPLPQLFAM
ncbi:hypothetical protein ABW43_00845 [Stenotrophomonas maltophilia]|nr:hypothetical protein ABW43_00845 [Stenotrophomonas maltophilia]MBA0221141.1 hypothetical protein [Stenotrophomonas maltophilia]